MPKTKAQPKADNLPTLILAASFDEKTRAEIEQHVSEVQSRRMLAAVIYHQGVNAKLEHEADKVRQRIARQYQMLGKEIGVLEKAEGKVQSRLDSLTILLTELGVVNDMLVT